MKATILITVSVLALSACSVAPRYERPDLSLPAGWSQSSEAQAVSAAQDWWRNFGSDDLNRVMAEALSGNYDLKASVQRIEQSRAALKSTRASLFPAIGASAGSSYLDDDGDSSESWNAGLSVSYEADLFGANRSALAGSEAGLDSSLYTHAALKLVVMGDVARAYFSVLSADNRLQTAEKNLKNAQDLFTMVEARFSAGADSALEVSQQKSALENAKASQASMAATLQTSRNALALLLGRVPQDVILTPHDLITLNVPAINTGVPSELLRNRPDILASESGLRAANADIGAARAALYPSLNLQSGWSLAAASFADPATTALSLAASLAAPIFQGGRLEAGVEQATARQKELIETYRQSVLNAFIEVENALVGVTSTQEREAAQQAALEQSQIAYDLAQQRYKAGASDFQTVLNAQSSLFSARDALVQIRTERLNAAVDLFMAVGGGYMASP